MIIMDESIRGIWFCTLIPGEQDFLLSLRNTAEEQYEIIYRFRYYNSDDPFDEKDKKSWYSGTIKGRNEKEVIAKIHEVFPFIIAASDADDFTELLRGDQSLDEFMEKFMEQDFVHAKQENIH